MKYLYRYPQKEYQALMGMLWSKQYYSYEVIRWLVGIDPRDPESPVRGAHSAGSGLSGPQA